jgi:hypothetical protein
MSTAPTPGPTDAADLAAKLDFEDPLGRQSADDSDTGWGERPYDGRSPDLARFLDEKPPHHL